MPKIRNTIGLLKFWQVLFYFFTVFLINQAFLQ